MSVSDSVELSSAASSENFGKTKSKSRGGSKKSEEVEVLVEENLVEEAITEAPTRGRRGAASKKPVPTKTGTRQTRGKKTDVEPETGTANISEEPASNLEEEPTKKSKVDKSVSMEESSEEETEKPKKGKRGAKTAAKKDQEISEPPAAQEPTRSSRRGAKTIETEIVEESVANV